MVTEQPRSIKATLSTALVLSLLLVATGAGCGNSGESTTTQKPDVAVTTNSQTETMAGYKMYNNTAKAFSIQYPEKWKMEEKFMETDVILTAPAQNGFAHNLNIIAKAIPGASSYSMKDLKDSLIENYKTAITDFKLTEAKEVKVSGQAAVFMSYTGQQKNVKASFVQYFVIKGDDTYVITITRPENNSKVSETEFTNMVNSFKITK